ncbi:MAG: ATP synthase F1 subunit delta [Planctomycetota bacterium]
MAKSGDKDLALARLYAASMLQAADTPQAAETMLAELTDLGEILDSGSELAGFLTTPSLDAALRGRSIEKMFRGRCSDVFVDSMLVINRKGRFGFVRQVIDAYRHLHEEKLGRIKVHVSTATALPDAQRTNLRSWAAQFTGKTPELIESVEPELIGGVVVRIGDRKFDHSVAHHLGSLCEKLMDRASRELYSGARPVAS